MFSVTDYILSQDITDAKLPSLISMLFAMGRGSEVEKAIGDIAFRKSLYAEFAQSE